MRRCTPRVRCVKRRYASAQTASTIVHGTVKADPYLPVPLTKRGSCIVAILSLLIRVAVEREPVLVRDFIFDSLYNPLYGYFAQKHTIFSAPTPIDFPNLPGCLLLAHRTHSLTRYLQTKESIYRS